MKECCRNKTGNCVVEVNPQPLENFSRDKKRKDGLTVHCKSCLKKYRDENKEARNKTIMEWRKRNPEKMREYRKREMPKIIARGKKWREKNNLLFRYGISNEKWQEMFAEQNGCCKICGSHQSAVKGPLNVDHCHSSKKVRALLCQNCNRGLGMFKDSPELFDKAREYLLSFTQ